jgi:two-component system LytT family response regulator
MKIKTIIVDDEVPARKIIREFLQLHPEIEIMADCRNAHEALQAVENYQPDLIFLDIQMPEINGFEFLEMLDERPQIIFCTAYDKYAIQAFEVNAVDYLLKPFDQDRFDLALEKVKQNFIRADHKVDSTEQLIRHLNQQQIYQERFLIKQSGRIIIINSHEIIFFEAMEDYVNIHTTQEAYLIQQSLTNLEKRLNPQHFIRVHRSSIVNIDYVKEIDTASSGRYHLFLKNGKMIPVSRTGAKQLKRLII